LDIINNSLPHSWQWQIKNSIKSIDELLKHLPLSEAEQRLLKDSALPSLPFSVTPYFVSLMEPRLSCPIFSQVVVSPLEHELDPVELRDPLGEEEREKVPNLIHRYPDRVLFLATDRCASYCRFCTRKRLVGQGPAPTRDEQEEAFNYIKKHESIKEIIFSGGDPLMLSNERLASLLERAFLIEHIVNVRIHTRMLSFAPMRIDSELLGIFKRHSPLYMVTHFNHARELTALTEEVLNALVDHGVVMLNQSVLLKGINDDAKILSDLFRRLVKNRCRPYYLHSCDIVTGAKHFRVQIKRAISLMEELRGHISGLLMPTLVVDIPGGHGKVPLWPNPIMREDEKYIYLKGFSNGVAAYPKY